MQGAWETGLLWSSGCGDGRTNQALGQQLPSSSLGITPYSTLCSPKEQEDKIQGASSQVTVKGLLGQHCPRRAPRCVWGCLGTPALCPYPKAQGLDVLLWGLQGTHFEDFASKEELSAGSSPSPLQMREEQGEIQGTRPPRLRRLRSPFSFSEPKGTAHLQQTSGSLEI